ncbi:hypothetical protein [Bacteroides finegoldii]|jgi:hypothetical protein|uniref:hypothetical protein n=1 Tax=Bacteroides finegoldii TaxID=338188 RepID=UPI00205CF4AA|nr:hypothetical protein [Bacteroides finegoldii]DAV79095.1 MAG TPA: hypothetical protein [Caudoviricetes sp.]
MQKLIKVPDYQKLWLNENEWDYFHFHNSIDDYWKRLMNNVMGMNDRFLPIESDTYSIMDDYYSMLNDSYSKIVELIPDALNGLLYDCLKLQFYEMAENIKNIHEELINVLELYHNE